VLNSRDHELDAGTWSRVFREAAALGVSHVHLSGGEPGARRDLVDIAANAREAGLHTTLITSGVGISPRTMRDLWEAGLEHVQVSMQDADAVLADRIAGHRGAFQRKYALAAETVRLGLPLTVNVVVHRANIGRMAAMVDLALKLKASRLEIAHVQYHGWALKNRAALMPAVEQLTRAALDVEELRRKHHGRIAIDMVTDDHARPSFNVTPSGRVLPSQAAADVPGLTFWNVRDHALDDIWANSPACKAFRTIGLAGHLAPHHAGVGEIVAVPEDTPYAYRRM
jgi:pyrroloquinoline quinone biosynthesis protein E